MQDDPRAEEQPLSVQVTGRQASLWMHLCRHPSCVRTAVIEDVSVLIRTGAAVKTPVLPCVVQLPLSRSGRQDGAPEPFGRS